jgi:hypothetical protein
VDVGEAAHGRPGYADAELLFSIQTTDKGVRVKVTTATDMIGER